MGIVRFVLKSTLVGSVVYYSIQQGLWSKSEDSVQLYGKIYNNIAPYVKDNIPKEVINELPPLPSTSDLSNSLKSSWNKGVIASMKFLSETPTYVTTGVQNISETIQGYIEQQSVSEKSQ
ncbi:PREDICTED: MICOS complex subunit MIC13-like isoform X2 [Cyphomyrmex costatus]|uniref:MICOS complex subunit MIC13-like isoform X2 n=1 Tax=Cyphomyrmex costatus TaxID=456900 RepID=UPI00085242C8|nr:PREDICTED: MICOS complex subunit MIC13-like isoform X2 [Cyphomyrmex costatus]